MSLIKLQFLFNHFQEEMSAIISKPQPLSIKPKVAIIKNCAQAIPLAKSILLPVMEKKTNADLALYYGRRFKVGWSFQNSLTMLTSANNIKALEKGNLNIN